MTSWADIEDDEVPINSNVIKQRAWTGSLPTSISLKDESVSKHLTEGVELVDSDIEYNLRNYHYSACDNNSSDAVKRERGTIRCGDTVVRRTFHYTPEYTENDAEELKGLLHSFDQCKVYDSEEGCLLSLFYYEDSTKINGKWFLSTCKKINAFDSRWPTPQSVSFGDSFVEALHYLKICEANPVGASKDVLKYTSLEDYTRHLDKNKVYTYILRNNLQNRIVCLAPDVPTVYFVGAFDKTTSLLVEGNDSKIDWPCRHTFTSVDHLLKYVHTINWKTKQGVIVYLPDQTQVKILNTEYKKYYQARDSASCIMYRYFELRREIYLKRNVETAVDKMCRFKELYGDYTNVFNLAEDRINMLASKIYKSYVNKYIRKKNVMLPENEFKVIQKCHNWHKLDRDNNRVSEGKVKEILNVTHASILYVM